MKCGMPSEWASARAPSTASGEQQALAPSVSGSAQSLTRDADDLRPALALEQRRDGAVDAAGHGDGDALAAASAASAQALESTEAGGAAASARCRASAASWAAWRLAGVRPPSASSTSSMPSARRLEHRRAVDHLGDRGGGGPVAPQPSASKLTAAIRPSSTDEREPREIAAGRAPGGAGEGASSAGPAPARVAQVVLEQLPIHALQGRRPRPQPRSSLRRSAATAAGSSRSWRQVIRVDAPSLGQQDPVALAVALEGPVGPVDVAAVELDDQPLRAARGSRPRRSARAREVGVEPRPRQVVRVEEGDEPLLELVRA